MLVNYALLLNIEVLAPELRIILLTAVARAVIRTFSTFFLFLNGKKSEAKCFLRGLFWPPWQRG